MGKKLLSCFRFVSLTVLSVLLLSSPLYAVSSNVAIIDSVDTGASGSGSFPTTTGGLSAFTFTILPIPNVDAAHLASFDTVLLNMASTDMNCSSGSLSAAQKSALVAFVNGGGKLLIWDPECPQVDYSWLPAPFTTSNPGSLGATGTLTINQNNDLASSVASSPKFIDANMLATQTDAAGDMNVMVTKDPNWCLSMSGQNGAPASGPVQTYAKVGSGLIIWNGLDIDYMATTSIPDSSTPDGNLAKLWLQQLQVTTLPSNCQQVIPTAKKTVPTMNEWGMIIFVMFAGLGSAYYMRRQRKES